jgi:signal transduction histidine kinase
VRKPVLVAATSTIGLAILVIFSTRWLGLVPTLQIMVTFLMPAGLMLVFYRAAKDHIETREEELAVQLAAERATYRATYQATNEYLANISHELTAHSEPCSLRAEALAVAIEYSDAAPALKVAVPDLAVTTDPFALRQVLHTLISNAVRHGGNRIAVWSSQKDDRVQITVSDDGPGVAQGYGDRLFERFVDLGASAISSPGAGTGLTIASELAQLVGGEMSYRRDEKWSHFGLNIPVGISSSDPQPMRVELEAQVG